VEWASVWLMFGGLLKPVLAGIFPHPALTFLSPTVSSAFPYTSFYCCLAAVRLGIRARRFIGDVGGPPATDVFRIVIWRK